MNKNKKTTQILVVLREYTQMKVSLEPAPATLPKNPFLLACIFKCRSKDSGPYHEEHLYDRGRGFFG